MPAAYDGSLLRAWRARSANATVPRPNVGSKAAESAALLRRQDDALLSSQSNLDHVTRLKLEIFLCDKAFPAVLSLSNDGNLRFAAASTYEL